jgi:hypothetical protein
VVGDAAEFTDSFPALRGDILTLVLQGKKVSAPPEIIELLDPAGSPVALPASGSAKSVKIKNLVLPVSGNYTLRYKCGVGQGQLVLTLKFARPKPQRKHECQ